MGKNNQNETDEFIRSEIDRNVAVMEREADAKVAALERESEAQTEERLAQIKESYRRKSDRLEAAFFVNRETWSAKIAEEVLFNSDLGIWVSE